MDTSGTLSYSGTIIAPDVYIGNTLQTAFYTQTADGVLGGTNKLSVNMSFGLNGIRIDQQDARGSGFGTGGYVFITGHGLFTGYDQSNPRFSVTTDGLVLASQIRLLGTHTYQSVNGATTNLARIYSTATGSAAFENASNVYLSSDNGSVILQHGDSNTFEARNNGYIYYSTMKKGSGGASVQASTSDGAFFIQTSSTKYKTDIKRDGSTAVGDRFLTLDPATWQDKGEYDARAEYREHGVEPDHVINMNDKRYYGLIAEDLVKAGLEEFVIRDEVTGEVNGLEYDKVAISLIPIIREQRRDINDLKVEIERLKK